jgi:hypothetical protein
MRFLLLLMLSVSSSIAGYGTELTPQTVAELMGLEPVQYTAEEVVAHIRVMNPGAEVPIYYIDDPAIMHWCMHLPKEDVGYILGLFREHKDGAKDITILGHWSREDGVLLHEFVHLLESEIPERREEIRRTFQKLFSPEFRIGSMDLEGPAEPNAPWPGTLEITAPESEAAPEPSK